MSRLVSRLVVWYWNVLLIADMLNPSFVWFTGMSQPTGVSSLRRRVSAGQICSREAAHHRVEPLSTTVCQQLKRAPKLSGCVVAGQATQKGHNDVQKACLATRNRIGGLEAQRGVEGAGDGVVDGAQLPLNGCGQRVGTGHGLRGTQDAECQRRVSALQ
jgi:hypothetical protein